jgi:HK97 family phage portal protein
LGLFDFFTNKKPNTDKETRSVFGQTILGSSFSASGETITKEQAIRIATVWSCVRVLSETIASLPICLYSKDDSNRKIKLTNDPLNNLVGEQPSPLYNSFMFFERALVDMSFDGNFCAYIERNQGGLPIALHPIQFKDVDVYLSPDGREVYYEVTQNIETPYPVSGKVQSMNMIHVKGLSFDGIVGKPPIEAAAETLGISISLDKHAGSWFKNGSQLGGILKHPGTLKPETAKRLKESWNSNYTGTNNTGKTAILEEGMEWTARTVPNNQAQFIESREYQVSDICRIFRVPNHLVNDLSRATYSNIEAQQIDFVVHTITPHIKRIESELNAKLIPSYKRGSEYFKFNLNAILRGDSKSRADYYRTLVNIGVLSPDEVRSLEDMNPMGNESEKVYMQSNMMPLDRLGEDTSREKLSE